MDGVTTEQPDAPIYVIDLVPSRPPLLLFTLVSACFCIHSVEGSS